MFFSIIVLFVLPKLDSKGRRIFIHDSLYKKLFWVFFFNFAFLGFLGSQTVDFPTVFLSLVCSFIHLYYFLIVLPHVLKVDTYLVPNKFGSFDIPEYMDVPPNYTGCYDINLNVE